MNHLNMAQAEREYVRWLILSTLYNAAPLGASESLVLSVIQGVPVHVTAVQVRKEMDYLAQLALITINKPQHHGIWHASILPVGIDMVEYRADCPVSIARPVKYWD